MYDLESKIQVDDSRINKIKYDSYIIKNIEALIARMQNSGIGPNDYINGEYESELIAWIKRGENLIRESPMKSFCKRVATIMQLDMEPKISFNIEVATEAMNSCLLTLMIRLGVEFSPQITLVLCLMATLLLLLNFVKNVPLEIKKVDDETIELLEKKCIKINNNHFITKKITEYTNILDLKSSPLCFFSPDGKPGLTIYPISFLPIAKNGIIFLDEKLSHYLDREEIGALIAHEMGHLKESQIINKALFMGIPTMLGFLFKLLYILTDKKLEWDLNTTDLVSTILMVVTTILCLRQKYMSSEYNADKVAIQLAGPLALSSCLRTLEKVFISPCDLNNSKWPRLFNTLKLLNLDDTFSTHPLTLKRIN